MPSRRQVLAAAAVSPALATLAPLAARADGDEPARSEDAPIANAPTREIGGAGPITELTLAGGFTVARTHEVLYGALPFVLEGEGERFQVDVLRRDASADGVFDTAHLSLFVVGGATAFTDPTRVRGARALGSALERLYASTPALGELSTFAEREAAHPHAALAIDV